MHPFTFDSWLLRWITHFHLISLRVIYVLYMACSGALLASLGLAVASDEFERFLLTVALYFVFVS